MFRQELQGTRLMPTPEVAGQVDETNVTAAFRRLEEEVRILFRFWVRERFRGQEWIVECIQEQRRNLDPVQILSSA